MHWRRWSCLPCLGWEQAAAGGLRCWGRRGGLPLLLPCGTGSSCTLRPSWGGLTPPGGPEPLRRVPPASRVGDCKHGMMKFREERNLLGLGLSTGFHDRYFILNHTCLRLYKEVRVSPACWLPARRRSLPLPALPFPSPAFALLPSCATRPGAGSA